MKRKSLVLIIICLTLCLCSCSKSRSQSSFTIQFIDVGQGDSALVECDGHYMLIDGGDTMAGDKVTYVLKDNKVQHLDILAISHLHQDHIGGLPEVLKFASKIDLVISNSNNSELPVFAESIKQRLEFHIVEISTNWEVQKLRLLTHLQRILMIHLYC